MAVKTKSSLKTENGNTIYVNQSGEVKADKVNTLIDNIIDSVYNKLGNKREKVYSIRTITVNDSIVESDDVILVDASGGNVSVTVADPASTIKKPYRIKRIDGTANTVNIVQFGTENLEFGTSISLGSQGTSKEIIHNGTDYFVTSEKV